MVQDYKIGNVDEIAEMIKKFGELYGENFLKFAEKFFNYKISYKLLYNHLLSTVQNVKNAGENLSGDLETYIGTNRYKSLHNTANLIETMENNIRYMIFNKSNIAVKNSPEQTPRLFLGINNGLFSGIRNEMNAMRIIHRKEDEIVTPGCKKRLTYIVNRFHNVSEFDLKVKNIPNAGQIARGEKPAPKNTPTIINSTSEIIKFLAEMEMPAYDDLSRYETINDFNMFLGFLKDVEKDEIYKTDEKYIKGERFPIFLQNPPHLAFMSLFLIKKIHDMDMQMFKKISEKFR